jgi:lysine/ornithine N-monooxygenase
VKCANAKTYLLELEISTSYQCKSIATSPSNKCVYQCKGIAVSPGYECYVPMQRCSKECVDESHVLIQIYSF